MKSIALIAIGLCFCSLAEARPVIIEESATLMPPPGSTYVRFGTFVGTNGEYALVGLAIKFLAKIMK